MPRKQIRQRKEYKHNYYINNKSRINQKRIDRYRTFDGRLNIIYSCMQTRYKDSNKKNINDLCSKQEFILFAENSNYRKLYNSWVESGYVHKLVPSIDRVDNNKGYTIDNIQFLTKSDNIIKGNKEVKRKQKPDASGKPIKLTKNNVIKIFKSAKKACDFLGKNRNAVHIAMKNSRLIDGWYPEYYNSQEQ